MVEARKSNIALPKDDAIVFTVSRGFRRWRSALSQSSPRLRVVLIAELAQEEREMADQRQMIIHLL